MEWIESDSFAHDFIWYRGNTLPQLRELHDQTLRTQLPRYELSGHALDEIMDEKLTNPDFVMDGVAGVPFFLAFVTDHC